MNRAKKFMSLLLALAMMLSMMTTAFAEMEGDLTGGSITINDAISGQIYKAYQILYLESYNATSDAYAYKANTAWAEWLQKQTAYVAIDAQGYVTWVDGADAAAFAKLAQAEAAKMPAADKEATASSNVVQFTDLKLGYYLVDTTTGTLCSLDTTNPSVEMEEKNEVPTVEKEVQEDSDNTWCETNDADINQTVNYKATITVQAGAENYVLHDTMSSGLTYTGVISVKIGDNTVNASNYTVTTSNTDGCTFEVSFNNEYIATLEAGTKIVVEYSAKLNEDAVVGFPGNPNEIKLQYGDENNPSYTPVDKTITYTWDMEVLKYANGDKTKVLADATFNLSTDEAGANVLKFHDLGSNKYQVCADADCSKTHVTEITTDETGTFQIKGLDSGTYYLTETAAPAGYNKLSDPIPVAIAKAIADTDVTYTTPVAEVDNKSGTELPSTGGMGTTMLYVGGVTLVAVAVVLLAAKKRKA